MQIRIADLLRYLLVSALFTTFFAPAPLYVIIYIVNIVVANLIVFVYYKSGSLTINYTYLWSLFLFITVGLLFGFIYWGNSDGVFLFKIIVNILFLATWFNVLTCFNSLNIPFFLHLEKSIYVLLIINFLQILIYVAIMDLWTLPFNVSNSSDAYGISRMLPLIGNENKNIWSSKLAFIAIIYFKAVDEGFFKINRSKKIFLQIIVVLSMLYLTSRTGITIIFLYFAVNKLKQILNIQNRRVRRLWISVFGLALCFAAILFTNVVLRLDSNILDVSHGHEGDGFKARIMLWAYLFSNISQINIFLGNGIMFAGVFFKGVFSESNLHNSFLNVWLDLGFLGLLAYLAMFVNTFNGFTKHLLNKLDLIIPFIACLMIQYSGYDNDIFLFFVLVLGIDSMNYLSLKNKLNK